MPRKSSEVSKSVHFGKIVATLGPASESLEGVTALADAGVDVFRLNFSHGSYEEQGQRATHVRAVEERIGRPLGIVADLQGPKLRVGTFADEDGVVLEPGAPFSFYLEEQAGNAQGVSLRHPEIFKAAAVGMDILVDDGRLRFQVDSVNETVLETTVVTGGKIKQKKGVNIPTVQLPIDAITAKDREDLTFALSQDVDWVALSFVQRPEDIRQARSLIGDAAGIIAKIEKPSAVACIEDIIQEVDAIMVARGDLGVEIPPEDVPSVQKRIIALCRQAGKPVIVATHMLDSMVDSPYPTRAEVSDVANAMYDGSDAVMLSAETAAGDYFAESASMMRRIVRRTVTDPEFFSAIHTPDFSSSPCVSDSSVSVARDAVQGAKYSAVVAAVTSFESALCYARRRFPCPLIAVTDDQRLARRLALVWGVFPAYVTTVPALESDSEACAVFARAAGISDTAVVTLS